MTADTPGPRLLLACVTTDDAALEPALRETLAAQVNVPLLALQHALVPLVHRRLRDEGLARLLPPDQWQQLQTLRLETVQRRLRLLDAGQEVLAALRQAGLHHHLPLKGWAMAALPGGETLQRDMADLDLLVDPEHVSDAAAVLSQVGFQPADLPWRPTPYEYHLPRFERGSVPLELHWRLWPPSPLQPFDLPDFASLHERAITGQIEGQELLVPSVEDQVLIAAAALAEDGLAVPLRQWLDLSWLLERVQNEARLWELARECRMQPFLRLVLSFVGARFIAPERGTTTGVPAGAVNRAPTASSAADLNPDYPRFAALASRRLFAPHVRRSSFWMLVALRRLAHRSPACPPDWLRTLPAHLRPVGTDRPALAALAHCGGAAIATGRLLKRLVALALLPAERRALREDLQLIHLLHRLARPEPHAFQGRHT